MILTQKNKENMPDNMFFWTRSSASVSFRKWAKTFCRQHRSVCLPEVLSLFRLFFADFYFTQKTNKKGDIKKSLSCKRDIQAEWEFFLSDKNKRQVPSSIEEESSFLFLFFQKITEFTSTKEVNKNDKNAQKHTDKTDAGFNGARI
jgi:hypothetical protein